MKYKIAELSGARLDAAVAIAEGFQPEGLGACRFHKPPVMRHGIAVPHYVIPGDVRNEDGYAAIGRFHPSGDWKQGGPIIERAGISLCYIPGVNPQSRWWAESPNGDEASGNSLLIAGMRAYAITELGAEVELP